MPRHDTLLSVTGYVLRIDRGSAHDGPGLRTTVVLKGCPLRCAWCDTPESHRIEPELVFREGHCVRCFECFDDCQLGAISETDGRPVVDQGVCRWCGECADGCSTDARLQAGSVMTESRVLEEVARDVPLHRQSGGGVTFSGGEPLLQADFLLRLLESCRALGIHTAVDTCSAAAPHVIDRVAELADLVLYDLKHLDDDRHRQITGSSNREILENLRRLARRSATVRVRFTLAPGMNDDIGHVRRLGEFVSSLGVAEIDVVPYRRVVPESYEALGRVNPSAGIAEPGADALANVTRVMAELGLRPAVVERRLNQR
jgi:pyruvate formate lyase activating enzyme